MQTVTQSCYDLNTARMDHAVTAGTLLTSVDVNRIIVMVVRATDGGRLELMLVNRSIGLWKPGFKWCSHVTTIETWLRSGEWKKLA